MGFCCWQGDLSQVEAFQKAFPLLTPHKELGCKWAQATSAHLLYQTQDCLAGHCVFSRRRLPVGDGLPVLLAQIMPSQCQEQLAVLWKTCLVQKRPKSCVS